MTDRAPAETAEAAERAETAETASTASTANTTTPDTTGPEAAQAAPGIAAMELPQTSRSAMSGDTAVQDEANPNWDASKVPPSQFQKRKGSIYATQASRDGHVERSDDAFHKAHEGIFGKIKKIAHKDKDKDHDEDKKH